MAGRGTGKAAGSAGKAQAAQTKAAKQAVRAQARAQRSQARQAKAAQRAAAKAARQQVQAAKSAARAQRQAQDKARGTFNRGLNFQGAARAGARAAGAAGAAGVAANQQPANQHLGQLAGQGAQPGNAHLVIPAGAQPHLPGDNLEVAAAPGQQQEGGFQQGQGHGLPDVSDAAWNGQSDVPGGGGIETYDGGGVNSDAAVEMESTPRGEAKP